MKAIAALIIIFASSHCAAQSLVEPGRVVPFSSAYFCLTAEAAQVQAVWLNSSAIHEEDGGVWWAPGCSNLVGGQFVPLREGASIGRFLSEQNVYAPAGTAETSEQYTVGDDKRATTGGIGVSRAIVPTRYWWGWVEPYGKEGTRVVGWFALPDRPFFLEYCEKNLKVWGVWENYLEYCEKDWKKR